MDQSSKYVDLEACCSLVVMPAMPDGVNPKQVPVVRQ